MAAMARLGTALGLLLGGFSMGAHAQDVPPLYRPPGMWTNDNWFCREGDTFHAFYLQVPAALGDPGNWALREGWQHVGHATSTDLVHWTDHGPALVAIRHTWNDLSIATGSIAQEDGRWWMVFTAQGQKPGIGLAVSDDLMRWTKVGDGPVVSFAQPFDATWEGQPVQWKGCADPYLYPEPIDGWWIIVLNSQIVGAPLNTSGCLTTLRSRDLLTWEPDRVLAYPQWFERLETPQLWQRNGRWYAYFGGAHDHEIPEAWQAVAPQPGLQEARRVNCVLIGDAFEGPYRPVGNWCPALPDGKWGYIHKVLPGPDGRDVLLSSVDLGISRPYPVTYAEDGSLVLHKPLVPSP
jgi:beta-fructofuranosidase